MSDAETKLMAARLAAAEKRPYLAVALWALSQVKSDRVGKLGVDQHWRLYYDPEFVSAQTTTHLAGIWIHEVWHLLREHPERAKRAGVGRAERSRWGLAVDCEINDDLVREEISLPDPLLPDHFGFPRDLLAEEYYHRLVGADSSSVSGGGDAGAICDGAASGSQPPASSSATSSAGDGSGQSQGTPDTELPRPGAGNCGSCAHGQPEPWELPPSGSKVPSVKPAEAGLIRREVARQVREYAKSRGSMPAGVRRWAEELLEPPRVDWRKQLAGAVRSSLSHVAGCVDYSYSRPSRRQAASRNGIIFPAMRRPQPEVLVVGDTSGSMSGHDLGIVIRELRGVLRTVGHARTKFMPCDAAAAAASQVASARDVDLIGGGGTDMREALKAAEKLWPRPDIAIILTDGFTPYPEEKPRGFKVIVALVGEDRNTDDVPEWARKVIVD